MSVHRQHIGYKAAMATEARHPSNVNYQCMHVQPSRQSTPTRRPYLSPCCFQVLGDPEHVRNSTESWNCKCMVGTAHNNVHGRARDWTRLQETLEQQTWVTQKRWSRLPRPDNSCHEETVGQGQAWSASIRNTTMSEEQSKLLLILRLTYSYPHNLQLKYF